MECVTGKLLSRDLKLENIIICEGKEIKIIDFGLSSRYNPGSLLKSSCGSPNYCPPEMLEGKQYDPEKSDIWSIGVALYTLACGYFPFEHRSKQKLHEKILKGEINFPNFVDKSLKELITLILKVDPVERPTIKEILENNAFNSITQDKDKEEVSEEKVYDQILKGGMAIEPVKRDIQAGKFNENTMIFKLTRMRLNKAEKAKSKTKPNKPVHKRFDSLNLEAIARESRLETETKKRTFSTKFKELQSSIRNIKNEVNADIFGKKATINIKIRQKRVSKEFNKRETTKKKANEKKIGALIKKKEKEIMHRKRVFASSVMTDTSIRTAIKKGSTAKLKARQNPEGGFIKNFLKTKGANI